MLVPFLEDVGQSHARAGVVACNSTDLYSLPQEVVDCPFASCPWTRIRLTAGRLRIKLQRGGLDLFRFALALRSTTLHRLMT